MSTYEGRSTLSSCVCLLRAKIDISSHELYGHTRPMGRGVGMSAPVRMRTTNIPPTLYTGTGTGNVTPRRLCTRDCVYCTTDVCTLQNYRIFKILATVITFISTPNFQLGAMNTTPPCRRHHDTANNATCCAEATPHWPRQKYDWAHHGHLLPRQHQPVHGVRCPTIKTGINSFLLLCLQGMLYQSASTPNTHFVYL